MDLKTLVEISIVILFKFHIIQAGDFYSFVKTKVPLSGIVETIPGVTEVVCILKCRHSKNCAYSATHSETDDCLHLSTVSLEGNESVLTVNLLEKVSTTLKYQGT